MKIHPESTNNLVWIDSAFPPSVRIAGVGLGFTELWAIIRAKHFEDLSAPVVFRLFLLKRHLFACDKVAVK